MKTPDEVRDFMTDHNPEALLADGLEDAFLGAGSRFGEEPAAVYDADAIIDILMERDGMDYEEAHEYFDFNVQGAYVGEHTPLYLITYKGSE